MRDKPSEIIEKYRIIDRDDGYGSDPGMKSGAFIMDPFVVIVSEGPEWEHVSVSRRDRTPTWAELERFRKYFWRDDEVVMQLHVPREKHIDNHPFCLHLWRPLNAEIPIPPPELV